MSAALRADLEQRFLRYVQIDTESQEESDAVPSTACQLDLLELLVVELQAMGVTDVHLTDYATVLATIPATDPNPAVPVVAFLAHVDTTQAFPGHGVKPRVHRCWDGTPIPYPDDATLVLTTENSPDLAGQLGYDIVTASGTTLLGADDKAGVAILMSLAQYLMTHRDLRHGAIRLCFTPDEEIGRGVKHLTPEDLAATWAYTLDGGAVGEISSETFSADKALVRIEGVATHPGTAFQEMVNAATLATQFVQMLPAHTRTPETTRERAGFIHLYRIQGTPAVTELQFILRDFTQEGLVAHGQLLTQLAATLQLAEPRARVTCTITAQYRNMRPSLEQDMRSVTIACQAMADLGIVAQDEPIRGGTDGAMLTAKGVPTPNLFTGMHEIHGPLEWVSLQDMAQATRTCLRIVELWAA